MVISVVIVICLRVTKAATQFTVNPEEYSPALWVVCVRAFVSSGAADGRAVVEDGAHSRSVSNITEPEVESRDCVG